MILANSVGCGSRDLSAAGGNILLCASDQTQGHQGPPTSRGMASSPQRSQPDMDTPRSAQVVLGGGLLGPLTTQAPWWDLGNANEQQATGTAMLT